MGEPRVISTEDVLRALPHHSPREGWHSHGEHLVPTDGCAACTELKRRRAGGPVDYASGGTPS
jgi:hypothetical protein